MSVFTGEFRMEGDTDSLPATVSVTEGMIKLTSRAHLIGEWPVSYLGIRESDRAVVLDVEGERVVLDLRDRPGFIAATGLKLPEAREEQGGKRTALLGRREKPETERPESNKHVEPSTPRPSLRRRFDAAVDEIKPDMSEIRNRIRALRGGPAVWTAVAVFLLAVIFVPTVVVVLLTIVGTAATLIATFAYLDDSLRVRFPNRYPPVVVLAAGLGVLTLAVLVAIIR
jgi:hypothetical protein